MLATLQSRWNAHEKALRRLGIVAIVCAIGWALYPLAIVLYVAFKRLDFPFDLEWCEGGSMYQAYRVLHGLPLYERSDSSWAPFPYPPAHTLLLALLGIVHLDFWIGRLASIAFFLLMCWFLYREVYLHSTPKSYAAAAGAFGVAVVACAYPYTGQWYDLVRVDSMMMCLCVWGMARVLTPLMSKRNVLTTAVIFAAAIFTKQISAVFVAWACLFAIVYRPKFGLVLSGVTLTLCLLLLGTAQWITHGDFWFWIVTNLAKQQLSTSRLAQGVDIILKFAPYAVGIPIIALALLVLKVLSARCALWTGALLVSIPASLLPYAKSGGYLNNLMPMLVLLGPVTMLLASDLSKIRWLPGCLVRAGALGAMVVFVALHHLSYHKYLPDADNRRAAANLNALVKSLPGGVVVPYFAFLPARNGHANQHWHRMAVLDAYYRGDSMSESEGFESSGARWALILSADPSPFECYVRTHFNPVSRLPLELQVHTVTGARASVDELWEKK